MATSRWFGRSFGRWGWLLAASTVLALVAVIVGGVIAIVASSAASSSFERSERANRVQMSAQELLQHLTDAETGQRGYLLTGDAAYLDPYLAARSALDDDVARLRELLPGGAAGLVDSIDGLATAKRAEMARILEIYDARGQAAAIAHLRLGVGRSTMDELRVAVTELTARASTRGSDAITDAVRSRQAAGAAVAVSGLVVIGMLVLMLVMLRQRGRWEEQRSSLLDELAELATQDPLTGLPNRRIIEDRLEHALGRWMRNGGEVAVVYLDLDGFKQVNDSAGHHVGDDILRRAATAMSACIREGDSLSRVGGDEFVAVFEGLRERAEVEALVDRLAAALAEVSLEGLLPAGPRGGGSGGSRLRASAGISLATETRAAAGSSGSGATIADTEGLATAMIRRADEAMYAQKRARVDRPRLALQTEPPERSTPRERQPVRG